MPATKTELFIIRHGRAGGNSLHILNGCRRDVPLTALGRRQAKALAAGWKLKPDAIVSSPMRRARQTAYYFEKRYGLKTEVLDGLHEHDLGDWTGRSAARLKHEFPDYFFPYENGQRSHFLKRVPGGESWGDIVRRTGRALEVLRKRYAGKRVLVVCHGIVAISMIHQVCNIDPPELWNHRLKNCGWVGFVFHDGAKTASAVKGQRPQTEPASRRGRKTKP